MAAPGTSPARWQLPDDLIAAVEAIAKARKQKPATIVTEALTAFITPLPVIEKAAQMADVLKAYSILGDFVDRGIAAIAENGELHAANELESASVLYSPMDEETGEPVAVGWSR